MHFGTPRELADPAIAGFGPIANPALELKYVPPLYPHLCLNLCIFVAKNGVSRPSDRSV